MASYLPGEREGAVTVPFIMFARLGIALGILRRLRGWSQADLARSAGIGKSQLSKYENGKELPKLDSLEKLLAILEVSAASFFLVVEFVDRQASALEYREDVQLEALEGVSSILPPALQEAFERLVRDTFTLQSELIQSVLRGEPMIVHRRAEVGVVRSKRTDRGGDSL